MDRHLDQKLDLIFELARLSVIQNANSPKVFDAIQKIQEQYLELKQNES